MGTTIYSTFTDPPLAERAAGALLDHGVRPEDISLVRGHRESEGETEYGVISKPPVLINQMEIEATGAPSFSPDRGFARDLQTSMAQGYGEPGTPVSEDDLSVLKQQSEAYGDIAYRSARDSSAIEDTALPTAVRDPLPYDSEREAKEGISITTGADAAAGAAEGTAWGISIGVLAAVASLAIPGFGLVLGGGALATALAGTAATAGAGAIAGAVTGFLKDQGVDEHVAEHYKGSVVGGGALLAVTVPSGTVDESTVLQILEKYGASVETHGGGYIS